MMTEDDVRARVSTLVDRARAVWAVLTLVTLGGAFAAGWSWWVLVPLVGCYLGYQAHIAVAAAVLVREVEAEGLVLEEAVSEVEVLETCPTFVGRYYDQDVPEWVDVRVGDDLLRYVFKDFSPRVEDGFTLPTTGDHILYKGAIFQPAQGQ